MNFSLSADDPPAFIQQGLDRSGPFFVIVDHAGQAIPRCLGDMGVSSSDHQRHIAYDIGAGAVGTLLASSLNAPLHASFYSRLVVDVNRDPNHPDSMPATSDGTIIPANQNITEQERHSRLDAIFSPYHTALSQAIDSRNTPVFPVFLHTMTNRLITQPDDKRIWPITVLHNEDKRLAHPLLAHIRNAGIATAANEPYSGYDHTAYCLRTYGVERGLPHVAIEIRQDLVMDTVRQRLWALHLTRWLQSAVQEAGLAKDN